MPDAHPIVKGRCPMGCGETLFLGSGGHVTCRYLPCPNPCAADDLLASQPHEEFTYSTEVVTRDQIDALNKLLSLPWSEGFHVELCDE